MERDICAATERATSEKRKEKKKREAENNDVGEGGGIKTQDILVKSEKKKK